MAIIAKNQEFQIEPGNLNSRFRYCVRYEKMAYSTGRFFAIPEDQMGLNAVMEMSRLDTKKKVLYGIERSTEEEAVAALREYLEKEWKKGTKAEKVILINGSKDPKENSWSLNLTTIGKISFSFCVCMKSVREKGDPKYFEYDETNNKTSNVMIYKNADWVEVPFSAFHYKKCLLIIQQFQQVQESIDRIFKSDPLLALSCSNAILTDTSSADPKNGK